MIQRLVTTLAAMTTLPARELEATSDLRLIADCADALRLELDCPQQELAPSERRALLALNELLEAGTTHGGELRAAADAACEVLGLHPTRSPESGSGGR